MILHSFFDTGKWHKMMLHPFYLLSPPNNHKVNCKTKIAYLQAIERWCCQRWARFPPFSLKHEKLLRRENYVVLTSRGRGLLLYKLYSLFWFTQAFCLLAKICNQQYGTSFFIYLFILFGGTKHFAGSFLFSFIEADLPADKVHSKFINIIWGYPLLLLWPLYHSSIKY